MTTTLPEDAAGIPGDLGPYRFDRRIGAGGMGEVFEAFDRRLGRRVAIKRLRSDRDDQSSRERFRREARAAARLCHWAIVQVFDLVETPGCDWIVMELVEGPRLADLTAVGPLPLPQALLFGRQVAEGLAAAHSAGFVHRDLKAENVLIAQTGQPTAKILDFGLVLEARPDGVAESLTATGAVLGTPRTLAPEQACGLAVGPRTDLFSFGVLLYEMLTGQSPFLGVTGPDTLRRIVSEPAPPLPASVPAGLAKLVGQLLQKAPELRPASAGEVTRRLERLSAELVDTEGWREATPAEVPTESHVPVSSVPRDSASFGPIRRSLRFAVLALLALGLGGIVFVLFFPSFRGDRPPAAVASEASRPFPAPVAPLSAAEAETLEKEAWAALDRFDLPGNVDRALALFQRLIDDDLESAPAHAGLARAYWRKIGDEEGGDDMWRDQALAVARRAVELDGKLASARVSLGVVLARLGQRDAARAELERARQLDPANADAWSGLAALHQTAEEIPEAEAAFRKAIELRPTDRTLHDLLGTLYFSSGRMTEAESEYRKSVELAPDGVYGLRNLAGVLIATSRLPEAAELLKKAIEVQPKSTLYSNLGTVYFYQGLYPAAAAAYQQALGFPDGAGRHDLWGNLGDSWRQIAHRRKGAPEAFRNAVRLIEPEVERDPENAKLRSQLALYLAKAGEAEASRRENLRVETTEGRNLFRLVIAAELAGDRELALGRLQQALQQGFSATEVAREPDLLALRSDTRFQRLLTKVAK